jgi:hypothetical protein
VRLPAVMTDTYDHLFKLLLVRPAEPHSGDAQGE